MDKSLLSPDRLWLESWKKIPAYIKWTFFSALLVGLVTHTYMFTNKFLNHDDVYHLFEASYGTQSGRWFLPTVLAWDGQFSMPWVIGLLGLFFLALTACFTTSLFHIRQPLPCFLTAALLVSSPSVAATYAYMFTADAYFFAAFLASFGAFAAFRYERWGVIFGSVAIFLAMGIYQAYFPLAVVLMLGALIMELILRPEPFFYYLKKSFTLLVTLILALVAYFFMVKVSTRNQPLVEYMGLDNMGKLDISMLPSLIQRAYLDFGACFFENKDGYYFEGLQIFLTLSLLASILLLIVLLWQKKVTWSANLFLVCLVLLYPLAGNLIYVMSGGADPHWLMRFPSIYFFILPLALASQLSESIPKASGLRQGIPLTWVWVIVITMALTSYANILTANNAYLKMNVASQQIQSYSNQLIQEITKHPDYRPDISVLLIGSRTIDEKLYQSPELQSFYMVGVLSSADLRASYSYGNYLNHYMAFPNETLSGSHKESLRMEKDPQVLAMPRYPDPQSIQKVGDYLIVKFN